MTLSPVYHPLSEAAEIKEIANDAIRLDNCINGNPRYYMGASSFRDMYGKFYRPAYVKAYRMSTFVPWDSFTWEWDINEPHEGEK